MSGLIFPVTKKEAADRKIPYSSSVNRHARFPERLRDLRKEKGVSQATLAQAIGTTKSTISLYEQGDTVPDVKTLSKIADFYGVPCDWLLHRYGSQRVASGDNTLNEIGLSERAIASLKSMNRYAYVQIDEKWGMSRQKVGTGAPEALNEMLTHLEMPELLEIVDKLKHIRQPDAADQELIELMSIAEYREFQRQRCINLFAKMLDNLAPFNAETNDNVRKTSSVERKRFHDITPEREARVEAYLAEKEESNG